MGKKTIGAGSGTPPEPLAAAAVILLREGSGRGFEVLLMKRHHKQSFMGSAFVFPGGRLDEADCDPDLAAHGPGLSAREAAVKLDEPGLDERTGLGLFFAAVRETFEEAGVLLAATGAGAPIDLSPGAGGSGLMKYRREIHEGRTSLKDLAVGEQIRYSLADLAPYSRWITPEVESKRFDARFMLARVPKGQAPVHDAVEMTESLWVTPREALERHESGEMLLMPPTLITLAELARIPSLDDLYAAAAAREIRPVLPQVFFVGDAVGLKLPHDPEYSIADFKRPPRPGDPSRLIMVDGRWKIIQENE